MTDLPLPSQASQVHSGVSQTCFLTWRFEGRLCFPAHLSCPQSLLSHDHVTKGQLLTPVLDGTCAPCHTAGPTGRHSTAPCPSKVTGGCPSRMSPGMEFHVMWGDHETRIPLHCLFCRREARAASVCTQGDLTQGRDSGRDLLAFVHRLSVCDIPALSLSLILALLMDFSRKYISLRGKDPS